MQNALHIQARNETRRLVDEATKEVRDTESEWNKSGDVVTDFLLGTHKFRRMWLNHMLYKLAQTYPTDLTAGRPDVAKAVRMLVDLKNPSVENMILWMMAFTEQPFYDTITHVKCAKRPDLSTHFIETEVRPALTALLTGHSEEHMATVSDRLAIGYLQMFELAPEYSAAARRTT